MLKDKASRLSYALCLSVGVLGWEPQCLLNPNPHPIWTDPSPSMIACACLSLYVHVLMCAKSVKKKKECKKNGNYLNGIVG